MCTTDEITVATCAQLKNTNSNLRGTVKMSVSPRAQLKKYTSYNLRTTAKIPASDSAQL
jgi:hypothetical protein